MTTSRITRVGALVIGAAFVAAACGPGTSSSAPTTGPGVTTAPVTPPPATTAALSGEVEVGGSSTVYPITEAVAEEFQLANPGVQVSAALSRHRRRLQAASAPARPTSTTLRAPIKADDEGEGPACTANNIEYVELQVAIDGLTVVVNPDNTFADLPDRRRAAR